MLKKLQNLLFEEDDDDILDDEDEMEEEPVKPVKRETVRPVKQQPVEQVVTPVATQMAQETIEEPKSNMQRIDVTQPVPTQTQEPVKAPTYDSLFAEESRSATNTVMPQQTQEKPKKLGITVDDMPETKPSKPQVKKSATVKKTAPVVEKKVSEPAPQTYEFKPVISPIFGVDEKDLHALKTTTTKISEVEKSKNNGQIAPIISPIYGTDQEDSPSMIRDTVEASGAMETVVGNASNVSAEDDIPEFSLDDILKVRDEEFTKAKEENTVADTFFPDLNMDEEEASEPIEQQIVLKRRDNK